MRLFGFFCIRFLANVLLLFYPKDYPFWLILNFFWKASKVTMITSIVFLQSQNNTGTLKNKTGQNLLFFCPTKYNKYPVSSFPARIQNLILICSGD